MRTLRLLTILLLLLPALGAAPSTSSAEDVPGEYFEEWVTSPDGTRLWAQVWRPAGVERVERTPVVLQITPYAPGVGGVTANVEPDFVDAVLARGWTFAVGSLRGFGRSDGCSALHGPGEQLDAVAFVEWADAAPWSNGRVGTYGVSYDGGPQLMAIAGGAPPDAAVIMAGLTGMYGAFYDDGVHYGADSRTNPFFYANLQTFYASEDLTESVPDCYADTQVANLLEDDRDAPFWAEREFGVQAAGTDVPILWTQGFGDSLVKPDHLLPVWSTLTGDSYGVFGQTGHTFGSRADRIEQAVAFLAHHLEDAPAPDGPAVTVQDNHGRWRGEEAWPPADASDVTIPLHAGSYLDRPGSSYAEVDHDAALWTFTAPLSSDSHLAGAGRLDVEVDIDETLDEPRLVVSVYDVAPDDTATLITRGATLLREDGATAVDLYPQDWIVRAGHRLGVAITGSDEAWYERGVSVTPVAVPQAALTLPLLAWTRARFLDGGVPHGVVAARPTQLPADLVATRTLPIDLPATTAHPCTAAPAASACPPGLRGAPAADGTVVELLDTELQLGPGKPLGSLHDFTPLVLLGAEHGTSVQFEVPDVPDVRDLTVRVDPDRLTGMWLLLIDSTGEFVGFGGDIDLWRNTIVFPDVEPGTYTLDIHNSGPAFEHAFGAELLPLARVTAVLHTD